MTGAARVWAVGVVVLAVSGCGIQKDEATSTTRGELASTTTSAPDDDAALAAFVEAADEVCIAAAVEQQRLVDPDGEGGAKALGTGELVRDWARQLREVVAPVAVAGEWRAGLDLLERSGELLAESEAAVAEGDLERAGELEGLALWSLQADAQSHFDAVGAPFRACFVE